MSGRVLIPLDAAHAMHALAGRDYSSRQAASRERPAPSSATPPEVTGFSEVTLQTSDLDGSAHFYTAGLGLTELAREDDRIWLAVGTRARLGLWSPGEKEYGDRGGAHVHFAFTVEPGALGAIAARLTALGADVRGPVEHDGGDRSLYARDPEGNVIEAWDLFERGRTVASLEHSG